MQTTVTNDDVAKMIQESRVDESMRQESRSQGRIGCCDKHVINEKCIIDIGISRLQKK